MKLSTAKEILTHLEKTLAPTMAADGTNAIKIGIEAINEVEYARQGHPALDGELLPGEAE